MRLQLTRVVLIALSLSASAVGAAVLPEDRADAMYHSYDGGGTQVHGPALLVRKEMIDSVSVYASHYADNVSGASIDVLTSASPYKETRTEFGLGVDYLYRDTILGLSYTRSDEPDYLASTLDLGVSHELFGGLTTVSLGYTLGSDEVSKVDTDFGESVRRYQYRLGLSQVLSKSLVVNVQYEGILESGYLNSPYRAARLQGLLVPERYPGTRDSYAVALRAIKGVGSTDGELGSSWRVGYRYFWDTWDVRAHTFDIGYQRRLDARWTLEPRYRFYRQSAASFYADDFTAEMTYMARDKELASFTSHALGAKAGYRLDAERFGIERATLNLSCDALFFAYDDFTDMRTDEAYRFQALTMQFFLSVWY